MRKKFKKIMVFLCLSIVLPIPLVLAIGGGGTGDSSESVGDGDFGSVGNFYYQYGGKDDYKAATYKFELVYFNRDGSRDTLGTIITLGNVSHPNVKTLDRATVKNKIEKYMSYLKSTGVRNLKLVEAGPLVELSNYIENGGSITEKFGGNKLTEKNYELIKSYITDKQYGFGMDESDMQREQDENPGRYDSYGYRILIQKIQMISYAGNYKNGFAATRKEIAADILNDGIYNAQGINGCVQLFGRTGGYSKELYTEQDDVHIKDGRSSAGSIMTNKGNGENYNRSCGSGIRGTEDKTPALANWNDGLGYNILWFDSNVFKDYDYSIDAACVGCDVLSEDDIAYVIQDTNDWDAIFASASNKNKNISGYYKKNEIGLYCREKYEVYFPRNRIEVQAGRFFLLNPEASELGNRYLADIPNFKPIKVVKRRECKVDLSKSPYSDMQVALMSSAPSVTTDFVDEMGTVKIRYNETYKDSKYTMSEPVELKKYQTDDDDSYTMKIENDTLILEAKAYYTLPDNFYRYVKKGSGEVNQYFSSPSSNTIDLGVSTLPVSFNNEGDMYGRAGEVQFSFELPRNDPKSKLYKAYESGNGDNSYLKTDSNNGNIYKQYNSGKLKAGEIEKSSCAIVFGLNTSAFKSCVNDRVNNSIGQTSNCYKKNKNALSGKTSSSYSCIILSEEPPTTSNECQYINGTYYYDGKKITREEYADKCCDSEEDANLAGRDWNEKQKKCCPYGTTYNSKTGECDEDIKKYCSQVGNTYYGSDGREVSKAEYESECCNSEADAQKFGVEWNPKGGYCCPAGTTYNPSTGKCDGNMDGFCRIENHKYYDFNGKEITKEQYDDICGCRIENGKYYGPNNNVITKDQYDKYCDPDTDKRLCPPEECENGCCPDGSCAPMPGGICPGSGGIDVIYRTIDLEDPFPGQDAENRATGANWCSYNITTQEISCAYNNRTVNEYITREKSGIKNGSKVYNENHVLYEVTLDAETINKVRSYNDKHKYDDWTLKCLDNGKACQSEFLKKEVDVSGKCASTSKTSFYTCDEPV